MELYFSAITGSPLYAKYRKIFETTGNQKLKFVVIFFLCIALFFVVIFLVPVLIPVLGLGVLVAIIVGLIVMTKKGAKQWKVSQQALKEFADHNSFSYDEVPYMQVSNENLPDIQLTLPFKFKPLTNSGYMDGTFHNLPFYYFSGEIELIDYKGMSATRSGQETRSLTIFTVTLPISLPKLFIDTKRNNVHGFEAGTNNIEGMQKYNLEGDFPQYYNVFAQKDDQINVLTILTPEVMQKLLEYKYYDIWLDGNKLSVFALGSPYEYFAGIPEVFPTTEMLLQEIDKISRSIPNS
jgi:hypothetical protein